MLRVSIRASCSRCATAQTRATATKPLQDQTRAVHATAASQYFFKLGDDKPVGKKIERNRVTGLSWYEGSLDKQRRREETKRLKEEARREERKFKARQDPNVAEERRYQTADMLIQAARLANADLTKGQSDQFSGWKETRGPGMHKRVTPHPLSKEALRSKVISASLDQNTSAQLGKHSSSVLFEPLMVPKMPAKSTLGGSEPPPPEDLSERTPPITFGDFFFPRDTLSPGDFVELREKSASVGIVMPFPTLEQGADQGANAQDLFVLLSTGEIALVRSSDVMFSIPNVIEQELTLAATPETREYVLNANSSSDEGAQDQSGSSDQLDARRDTNMDVEPVDEARFEARASICSKLRILERQKEREVQRLLPVFQSMFLVDPQQSAEQYDMQALEEHFPRDDDFQLSKALTDRMDLRTGSISTPEATRLLYETLVRNAVRDSLKAESVAPLTAATVYACHVLLMENPAYFLADGLSHRISQLFTCRTTEERQHYELCVEWELAPPGSLEHGYIASFCEKAKKVRAWREANPYDDSGAPRAVQSTPELDVEWSQQDKVIISFLKTSLSTRRLIQIDTHGSVAMSILKRAGAHIALLPHPADAPDLTVDEALSLLFTEEGRQQSLSTNTLLDISTDIYAGPDLQHVLVTRFLKDIGVLTDWQNPVQLDATFRTITRDGDAEKAALADQATPQDTAVAPTLAQKHELTLDEQIEDKRTDFGRDATVYVIDSADALELDDGISIEPVVLPDRETEQAWVHIHIADPTALIQPKSPLDLRASRRFSSLYFPEAHFAMLPDDFVASNVGLRQSKPDGEAQRTMTFSALVDLSSGLVQDTKVHPGLVHDVQTISYERASKAILSSGDLPPKQTSDLSLLFKIAEKLSEIRARGSAIFAFMPRSDVRVSPLPLPSVAATDSLPDRPQFYAGHPTIDLLTSTGTHPDAVPKVADFMVSELMILAGRIAGTYGRDYNLPLPYRAQPSMTSEAEIETVMKLRTNVPALDSTETLSVLVNGNNTGSIGHNLASYYDIMALGVSLPATTYTPFAAGHFMLGIPPTAADVDTYKGPRLPEQYTDAVSSSGYLRATSPLRRYADMMVHWQLKNHIVRGRPLLRKHEIAALLPQFQRQEKINKQLNRSAVRYWSHSLVRYALAHRNDPTLSEEERARLSACIGPWDATVLLAAKRIDASTLKAKVRVLVDRLDTPADLLWELDQPQPVMGESFKVEIINVISAGLRSGLIARRIA